MSPQSDRFAVALRGGAPLIGMFCCSYGVQVAEAVGRSGFDFLIFDAEHCPHSLPTLHGQFLALAGTATAAVVRAPQVDLAAFKQYLDLGADAIMVPNVESAAQAETVVRGMHYPPRGMRGVGGSVRATAYGRQAPTLHEAGARAGLIVQVESRRGLEAVQDIARVDGVDAVFFGPHDLAADLGLYGEPAHPHVVEAIEAGIDTVLAQGKRAGVLAAVDQAPRYIRAGASLIASGSDLSLLVRAADDLARQLRGAPWRQT
ncbi:aldolase/citrate lyase family protein [Bordetella bronchiseptica]|uniref:HpcH/HpaI aldolase family protein n=1 Tax=Bordetella bronchiseptica TaxID=518 RepID=UPI003F74527B|nr:4-hydroxy-2-oxo-heptane-1,7-dioate aldolase [Bordetella bronchiseptica]